MTKPIILQRILLTIVLSAGLVLSVPSNAQNAIAPKPLNISFLLELAQKLFERGEFNEAHDVLKRILKTDPENPPVQRLLKNVEDQLNSKASGVLKVSRPSEIASDIIMIQKNVLVFERRNRELEFAIRKTLQENMFLYQTLSRRSQDLLALRKKFFGYEEKQALTTSSPAMDKTNEALNTYQEQIAERDIEFTKRNQEIALLMKAVGKTGSALKDNKEMNEEIDSSANALEWKNDLIEKRSYLVEKTITLYDKNKDLIVLHAELAAVSKSLKEANEDYGDTVSEYEAKIQNLNNVWVQDKAKQQVEIDRLKEQIKDEKLKLFSSRLSGDTDPTIVTTAQMDDKPALAQATSESPDAKTKIVKSKPLKAVDLDVKSDLRSEIKRLQAELARKEQELSDRSRLFDAKIRELKGGWAQDKDTFQGSGAGRTPKSALAQSDYALLKESDTYRNLIQELEYIHDQLSMREEEVYKFQKEVLGHTDQMESLQKRLSESENRLVSMDALIVIKDQQIAALKKELVVKLSEIKAKDAQIKTLKARNVSLEGLQDLNKRTVNIKTIPAQADSDEAISSVEKLKGLVSELEGSLLASPSSSSAEAEELRQQLKNTLETLQEKEKQVEQFYSTLEQATEKLKATSISRGQEPTPSVLDEPRRKVDVKIKDQDWDPKDNDVYALQQRLSTLSKELRFTQEELAERTKEKGQLQSQLEQKEAEPAKALSEKDILELENELATFRQQSDLTRATIRLQQESLEKSQKEVDRKERSLKSILDQSEKLRKQIDGFKSTVKEKDEQIELQQKALDHEIKKNDTLSKKLREIQKTAAYEQERDAGKLQSMTNLKENVETFEILERDYKRQINDIQEQLKTSYVMIEDGEQRVMVLQKRLAIREERIAELQKELDKIKEKYNKSADVQTNQNN